MLSRLFQRLIKPAAAPEAQREARYLQAVNLSLDLQAAMAAHESWKIRLEGLLNGYHDEPMRPEEICFDDRCELGRWLHGAGRRQLGHLPSYGRLVEDHKTFHHAASNVLSLHQAGHLDQARRMRDGSYRSASRGVMLSLETMKHVVEQDLRSMA